MAGVTEIIKYQGELKLTDVIKAAHLEDNDEPLNVCDLSIIIKKLSTWQKYLSRVKPFYAVKCNDDEMIVKTLASLGIGFDCASMNEIKQVLEEGVEPQRIIFANPCRPLSHMNYARDHKIEVFTVDHEFEIYKIYKNYPEFKLVIRFLCEAKQAQCPLGAKFGCNVENDATALMLLAKSLNLQVTGTSFHVGSGCADYPAYGRAINFSKDLHEFGKLIGFEMRVVDIGGGFPGDDDDKFKEIADIINSSLDKNFPDESVVEIIAEPGRFCVCAAYTLICKIYAKREIRNSGKLDTIMYYLNDGFYGSFNCILYENQKMTPILFMDADYNELPKFKSLIWGPSCDALDKVLDDLYLPNLSCGDFIGFPNMGAYSVALARPFNGFPLPRTLYFMEVEN